MVTISFDRERFAELFIFLWENYDDNWETVSKEDDTANELLGMSAFLWRQRLYGKLDRVKDRPNGSKILVGNFRFVNAKDEIHFKLTWGGNV